MFSLRATFPSSYAADGFRFRSAVADSGRTARVARRNERCGGCKVCYRILIGRSGKFLFCSFAKRGLNGEHDFPKRAWALILSELTLAEAPKLRFPILFG